MHKHFASWTCRCCSANRPSIFACRNSKKSRRSSHRNKVGGTWSNSPQMHSVLENVERFAGGNQTSIASAPMRLLEAASFDPIGLAALQLIQPCYTWDILRHLPTLSNTHISLTRSTKPSAKEAKNDGTHLAIRPHVGAASAEKTVAPVASLGFSWCMSGAHPTSLKCSC